MDSVFGGDVNHEVFVVLVLFAAIISTAASSCMLILIRLLNTWNGYTLLITTMTSFQLLYNVSFFTGVIDVGNDTVTIISNVCQLFSGLGTSLTTNLVAYIAFYVIYYKKSLDIFYYYKYLFVAILIPALGIPLLYLFSISKFSPSYITPDLIVLKIYYYIKIASICANFVLVVTTFLSIRRMSSRSHLSISHSEMTLNLFTIRLFYYPIIQTVSRVGFAWYEIQYGYNYNSDHTGFHFDISDDDKGNNQQFIAQCVLALSMPIASVGYLVIFLIMQPVAYRVWVSWFTCGKYDNSTSFSRLFAGKNSSWSSTTSLLGEDMNGREDNYEASLLQIADENENKKITSSDQLSNFDGKIYCYSEEGERHAEEEFIQSYNNQSVLSWFSYSWRSDNSPQLDSVDHSNTISTTIQSHQPD